MTVKLRPTQDTDNSRLGALFLREWQLLVQARNEYLYPLMFYVLSICLFPLGLGPESGLLQSIAPAILWIMALISSLLSLDTLFRRDFEDGTLEQLLLTARPAFLVVFIKVIVHWLATGIPLLLMTPVLAYTLSLPEDILPILLLGLLLGTPILSFLCAMGAALAVTLRSGGILSGLILLPFFVPVLILGTIATNNAAFGLDATPALLWLGVILAASVTLMPFVITAVLRATLFS